MTKPASFSGGVPVFSIGGRMIYERERLLGMTDGERRWRAQYLKDQILSPDEPRFSPELYKSTTNIFRRIARIPLDLVMIPISPLMSKATQKEARVLLRNVSMSICAIYGLFYMLKYNPQDWTRQGGLDFVFKPPRLLPGDPDYPNRPKKQAYEYGDQGFSKSVLC
ncbi:UNVERIFIED_CONTAM: hypothetical protein PYX00_000517 [Menopon gallinae]|uniref:NADH dehydrogenase [ubiquinone] 1 beta subcomplex subunit 6 n=1 Tax=Menopon gallinae TaxID=328185 RepID=A0AAW2I9I9_9NEOP